MCHLSSRASLPKNFERGHALAASSAFTLTLRNGSKPRAVLLKQGLVCGSRGQMLLQPIWLPLGGCVDLCIQFDPHHLVTRLADTFNVQAALQAYSARGGSFTADEALTWQQKALTSKLDNVSWARQLAAAPLTAQALLRSHPNLFFWLQRHNGFRLVIFFFLWYGRCCLRLGPDRSRSGKS